MQLLSTGVPCANSRRQVQRSVSPRLKVITVCPLKLESSSMPRVEAQVGCRIFDLFCASLSLVSWHWSVREITARSLEEWLRIRCGEMRCTVVKDGIGCCTFGRRWFLPEMQGGFREPHESLVVLPSERAVQIAVEFGGPCSCQCSGLIASYACCVQESRRRVGTCSPWKISSVSCTACGVSLMTVPPRLWQESTGGCLKPHFLPLTSCKLRNPR